MVDSSRRVRRGSVTPSDTMPEGYVKTSFANSFERYGVHVVDVPRRGTTAVDRCVPQWVEAIFECWHKTTIPTQTAELALYKAAENEGFRDAVSTIACLGKIRSLRDFLLAHDFDTEGSS